MARQVREVMTDQPLGAGPGTTVQRVAVVLRDGNVGAAAPDA
ncbi:hypothetical protein [Streptomyces pimonensis]